MDEFRSIPAFSFDKNGNVKLTPGSGLEEPTVTFFGLPMLIDRKGLFTSKTLPVCVINPHDWAMLAPSDPVLAERERCAKIAESRAIANIALDNPQVIARNQACAEIAARIRSGE